MLENEGFKRMRRSALPQADGIPIGIRPGLFFSMVARAN
jgi:hypothetical protein